VVPGKNIVGGGVFVVRILDRPAGLGDKTLPERLLTLSSCLTEFFPDAWAVEWASCSQADRTAAALKLDLSQEAVPELVRFVTDALSDGAIGWPCVWNSLDAARAAAHKFSLAPENFAMLELGVPDDAVEELLAALEPGPGEASTGIYASLQRRRPLRSGGTSMGWELLGVERAGDFHSWLCNSLQDEAERQLGVRPGPFGLLRTEKEARAVAALIANGVGAEPVPWFPALLTRHHWFIGPT
jgi:hypothetical protein